MTQQDLPLSRRNNEIKDSEIPKAQADLDKDLLHHGWCYRN